MSLMPFSIHMPQDALDDLQARLTRTRWADEISDGWTFGTSRAELVALVEYWANRFDWRRQEDLMNQFHERSTARRRE
ncbi:MAG TPA: epoxide hydrolase N-terminal domain-containing protein [Vicinamibacterales bacterium]